MIFYFNAVGLAVGSIPERVFQGSNKAGEVIFACPTAKSNAVDVAFTLPDGKITPPFLMDSIESVGGVFCKDGEQFNFWKISLPASVTYIAGMVKFQFFVTNASGERLATSVNAFMVEKGVPVVEPEKTDSWEGVAERLAILDEAIDLIAKKDRINEIDENFPRLEETVSNLTTLIESANKNVAFENYESCFNAFLNADALEYKVGQSVYIKTLKVPDLWVYEVGGNRVEDAFMGEDEFLTTLQTNGKVKVGSYTLCVLESSKLDLSLFVARNEITVTDNGDGTATLVLNIGE